METPMLQKLDSQLEIWRSELAVEAQQMQARKDNLAPLRSRINLLASNYPAAEVPPDIKQVSDDLGCDESALRQESYQARAQVHLGLHQHYRDSLHTFFSTWRTETGGHGIEAALEIERVVRRLEAPA